MSRLAALHAAAGDPRQKPAIQTNRPSNRNDSTWFRCFARYDLVILDELGYVPLDRAGAGLLCTFITKIYERRSLVVTTNLPYPR
ncbi:transposase/IS protein [Planctomycetes bacterium Poly30]|uniref:Transposase/IS protein n=1 Tax=Saltatorellus ferox TaxID=2528018 RepID=A0A518F151_9BACT|nr:transposase/IS protein [Planctomycetes bacterium Poly30]